MMFKNSKKYAIELDGITYGFSGNRLEQLVEFTDTDNDIFFISDMRKAVSMTMTIESPAKYVEIMVRKNLQESGEFDEPLSIITHWKKKKGPNATDIFFTALPTRILYQYYDRITQNEDSVILFPLYSVLFTILKKMRSNEPVAVIFQHNRFADLIIGTKKRVYYANRCVAFDESEEQISTLWNTVRTDINTAEVENRIKVGKIVKLLWLNRTPPPEWPEDIKDNICFPGDDTVLLDGEKYHLPFIKAVRTMSGINGISSPREKVFYYTKRIAPYANIVFFWAAFLLVAGAFWYNHQINVINKELTATEKTRSEILREISRDIPRISYKEPLSFVRNLAYCQDAPSFKEVINDISNAISADMKMDVLKMDYTKDEVRLEVFGKSEAPFDKAYMGYQNFERILKEKKYAVEESKFDTEISSSIFLLKLRKKIR